MHPLNLRWLLLLSVWLWSCGGRLERSTGSVVSGGAGGTAGTSGAGHSAGGLHVDPRDSGNPSTQYPAPFDQSNCVGSAAALIGGSLHCVSRTELARQGTLPNLRLDGGVDALGPAEDWRCPTLDEINFAKCELSEGCCADLGYCGPVLERAPVDAGEPDDASPGEQLCCYYVVEECGV